jgi:hypothetical protein
MDAARALQDFLATLSVERNASRHTLDAYRRDLADFFALLGRRRVTAATAGPDDVVAWMECQRKAGRKASTIARRMAALRGFYGHCVRERLLARDPTEHVEQPRLSRPLPKTLSREAVAALVEAPDVTTPRGLRDRTMLELLYASGLRASECLTLRLGDVNRSAGYVQCMGKGRTERLVPIPHRGPAEPPRPGPGVAVAVREPARAPAVAAVALADRAARRPARRRAPAGVAAHAAPLLREPPAGGRRGSARRPDDARARRHRDHADLHPPAVRRDPPDVRPVPPAGGRPPRP